MIVFVVGTTAEIVKITPVLHQLTNTNTPYEIWYTGMHTSNRTELFKTVRLPEPNIIFPTPYGKDVTTPASALKWFAGLAKISIKQRKKLQTRLIKTGGKPLIVVHGDTFSTVFGAVLGKWLKVPVAHIEAGLRSGSLTSPFPEELNRKIVGQLTTLHFPPTNKAVANLKREHVRGTVINTNGNTVVDNLQITSKIEPLFNIEKSYGVVTLHRSELLHNTVKYKETLKILAKTSHKYPLVVLYGSSDKDRLFHIKETLDFSVGTVFSSKVPHGEFKGLLLGAGFVVTDSGGLQEECAVLGVPCLVHRKFSEREDGFGANVILSGWDLDVLENFLVSPYEYRTEGVRPAMSPSAVIVESLKAFNENKFKMLK